MSVWWSLFDVDQINLGIDTVLWTVSVVIPDIDHACLMFLCRPDVSVVEDKQAEWWSLLNVDEINLNIDIVLWTISVVIPDIDHACLTFLCRPNVSVVKYKQARMIKVYVVNSLLFVCVDLFPDTITLLLAPTRDKHRFISLLCYCSRRTRFPSPSEAPLSHFADSLDARSVPC